MFEVIYATTAGNMETAQFTTVFGRDLFIDWLNGEGLAWFS